MIASYRFMRGSESLCAFRYKVNMGALAENLARGADRIGNALDAADT